MALTPVDILHTEFKTSLKGYNRQQVDDFVRQVRESLEDSVTERIALQRKLEELQSEVDRMKKIEAAMSGALTAAQKAADEMKSNAHQQAKLILSQAEQERLGLIMDGQRDIDRLRSETALLQGTRDRFEAELRAVLTSYLEWLDKRSATEDRQAEVA